MALPDSFTGANGTALTTYDPLWVSHATTTGVIEISGNSATRRTSPAANAHYIYNSAPASADYDVVADFATTTNSSTGVVGRSDATAASFYWLRYASAIQLYKCITGTFTLLGSVIQSSDGVTRAYKLSMVGTTIKGVVDGVEKISVTDAGVSATGFGGLRINTSAGLPVDNFDISNMAGGASLITIANSTQTNSSSSGAIGQTHQVTAANASQANTGAAVAVQQTHKLTVADSSQVISASGAAVTQISGPLITIADSAQVNTASSAAIRQTHLIVSAPVAVDNVASASSIVQTHLLMAANGTQVNSASAVAVVDGSIPVYTAGAMAGNRPTASGYRQERLQAGGRSSRIQTSTRAAR